MDLNTQSGRFDCAHWLASPNHDKRPHRAFIQSIIIHAISLPPQEFGERYVEDFFCNRLDVSCHPYFSSIAKLKVSAHFYIRRDGKIIQFVSVYERAWHAGVSILKGLQNVNDFSIGVELEGCDELEFTNIQYQQLARLCCSLKSHFPAITEDRIVGHCDIAPGRKTDPGPYFNWPLFRQSISVP